MHVRTQTTTTTKTTTTPTMNWKATIGTRNTQLEIRTQTPRVESRRVERESVSKRENKKGREEKTETETKLVKVDGKRSSKLSRRRYF